MSQEDVEALRRLYETWLRGDLGLELLHPEISMVEVPTLPGAVSAYGFDAVRRYMEIEDGKVRSMVGYADREEVLEAAGLAPHPASSEKATPRRR
jgi:hypothetical protein